MPTFVIRDVRRATPRTRLVQLDLDATPFAFAAGQAVMAAWPGGGPTPYSIASPPAWARVGRMELLVPAEGAFGGAADLAGVVGRSLELSEPFGAFSLPVTNDRSPVLLIAGGTGIAPIRSILLDLRERPVGLTPTLVYSARALDEFAFDDELRALQQSGGLHYVKTVTRDEPGAWAGRIGRVDRELLAGVWPGDEAWALVCGPPEFVSTVTAALDALGAAPDRVIVER